MSKLTNQPANLDAVAAIYADPNGVMLGQDSGAASILAKSAELRSAVRWFAGMGAKPETRQRKARATFGDAPVTDHVEKVSEVFTRADTLGADVADASEQTLRNIRAGATFYAACLAFMTPEGFAATLERASRNVARDAGNVLRGTGQRSAPIAKWSELDNLALLVKTARDEAETERKAKADKRTARVTDAGSHASTVPTDADADLSAIRKAFDMALSGLDATVTGVAMAAQGRAKLALSIQTLREVRAMLDPVPAKPAAPVAQPAVADDAKPVRTARKGKAQPAKADAA